MKIEEFSVGDKFTINVEVEHFGSDSEVLVTSGGTGYPILVSRDKLEPRDDKYKQALIDLYKAYSKRTVSMSECVNFNEYKKADDDRRLAGLDALKSALALGAELVEGGES